MVAGLSAPLANASADLAQVEVVTSIERLVAIEGEYDHLNNVTSNTLPFALHGWHVAWWKFLSQSSAAVRDSLLIHVVRDRTGNPIAIVPLVLTQRTQLGLRVASVAAIGSDPALTEIRTPLVAPGHELRALLAVQQRLSEDVRWDWIHWTGLSPRLAGALESACPRRSCLLEWAQPLEDGVLDLESNWERFHAKLKRNIRESLRHCYNSLKREGLRVDFEVARTQAEVKRGVTLLLPLHAMRAGAKGTIQHPDRFGTARFRAFLYEACDRLASRDKVRVFLLKHRDEVVAARLAFVVGDSMYLYYSGFDPAWGKFGVMTTTVAEAIKYAISCRLRTVNLSPGIDVSKTRWGVRRIAFREAIQGHGRLRSRLALAAYRHAKGVGPRPLLGAVVRSLPMRSWT
jgi:CelD/BcsL family acetyltransferase involved in cellulose biosynthesis